jgi:hypothetical protein
MSIALYATNIGLNVEAHINVENVQGLGSSVLPRIYFQVKLSISEEVSSHFRGKVQAWSFGMLTGELFVGSHEKIADIRPYSVNQIRLGSQDYATEAYLNIEIPLDAERIEWLEQKRAGKSFEAKLHIDLQVHSFGANQHTPEFPCGLLGVSNIQGDIAFTVPDTQWRERVLPGLGYGKVLVVELPAIGMNSCAALDHSFKALKKAQHQFSLGLYDETAGSCRVALDQFFEQVPKEEGSDKTIPKLKKSWETKLGSVTHRWLDECLIAIKEPANKPHHSPNNHFDRLGAQMLMMITTALVSYAAQQLDAKESQ